MIIVCQKLLKIKKINGIALFPFIFIQKEEYKYDKVLINHEKIHLQQQKELLIFIFYLWYVIEFYYWFFRLKDSYSAYRNIAFEKEAYAQENDMNYLKKRKLFQFFKYLKNS